MRPGMRGCSRWSRISSRPPLAGRLESELVEAHRAAGQDLALGLRGELLAPGDQIRRAGEESVRVRVIGGPEDLVRTDVVGQHGEAALDRLERDPAVALEQL